MLSGRLRVQKTYELLHSLELTVSKASWLSYSETRLYQWVASMESSPGKFIVQTWSKWIDPVLIQFYTKWVEVWDRCGLNPDLVRTGLKTLIATCQCVNLRTMTFLQCKIYVWQHTVETINFIYHWSNHVALCSFLYNQVCIYPYHLKLLKKWFGLVKWLHQCSCA